MRKSEYRFKIVGFKNTRTKIADRQNYRDYFVIFLIFFIRQLKIFILNNHISTIYLTMLRWGSFESPARNYEEIERLGTFGMVLKTWSDWLQIHVNRSKTKIYFITNSVQHERYNI